MPMKKSHTTTCHNMSVTATRHDTHYAMIVKNRNKTYTFDYKIIEDEDLEVFCAGYLLSIIDNVVVKQGWRLIAKGNNCLVYRGDENLHLLLLNDELTYVEEREVYEEFNNKEFFETGIVGHA